MQPQILRDTSNHWQWSGAVDKLLNRIVEPERENKGNSLGAETGTEPRARGSEAKLRPIAFFNCSVHQHLRVHRRLHSQPLRLPFTIITPWTSRSYSLHISIILEYDIDTEES